MNFGQTIHTFEERYSKYTNRKKCSKYKMSIAFNNVFLQDQLSPKYTELYILIIRINF